MQEKDSPGILRALGPRVSELILTRPSNDRAMDPELLHRLFPGSKVTRNAEEAIRLASENPVPGRTVLVTGSLYLAGEVRALLSGRRCEAAEA